MCCDFVLFEILRYVHAEWSKSVLTAQLLNSFVFWTPKIYGSTLVPNAFIFGIFVDTFCYPSARWWWIACAKQETDKTMISMRWSTWNSWFNPRGVHLINSLHLLPLVAFPGRDVLNDPDKVKDPVSFITAILQLKNKCAVPTVVEETSFRESRKWCAHPKETPL